MIPHLFIKYASDILANTEGNLTGSIIAKLCVAYAVEYNKKIPNAECPFEDMKNKRTALKENLLCFSPEQQYKIILDLCNLDYMRDREDVQKLKIQLISRYGEKLSTLPDYVNVELINETVHWLQEFQESFNLYNQALAKYKNNIFERNTLDDLRLSFEKLLQNILNNNATLEKQRSNLGNFLKEQEQSSELRNAFTRLVDLFAKYQNEHVKHNSKVAELEIDLIFDLASSYMKYVIKVFKQKI